MCTYRCISIHIYLDIYIHCNPPEWVLSLYLFLSVPLSIYVYLSFLLFLLFDLAFHPLACAHNLFSLIVLLCLSSILSIICLSGHGLSSLLCLLPLSLYHLPLSLSVLSSVLSHISCSVSVKIALSLFLSLNISNCVYVYILDLLLPSLFASTSFKVGPFWLPQDWTPLTLSIVLLIVLDFSALSAQLCLDRIICREVERRYAMLRRWGITNNPHSWCNDPHVWHCFSWSTCSLSLSIYLHLSLAWPTHLRAFVSWLQLVISSADFLCMVNKSPKTTFLPFTCFWLLVMNEISACNIHMYIWKPT